MVLWNPTNNIFRKEYTGTACLITCLPPTSLIPSYFSFNICEQFEMKSTWKSNTVMKPKYSKNDSVWGTSDLFYLFIFKKIVLYISDTVLNFWYFESLIGTKLVYDFLFSGFLKLYFFFSTKAILNNRQLYKSRLLFE